MATSEGGESPAVHAAPGADADVVITTVVSADDPRPAADTPVPDDSGDADADERGKSERAVTEPATDDGEELEWVVEAAPQA
ncbi:MAG: hypothetical protein M3326_15555, partial [Actinomycetota bacterium]|nr:hypothetical protein [Actinomycetota bacterium]